MTTPTGGVQGQVSATVKQQFGMQVRSATSDKVVTPQEQQQLLAAVQGTELPAADKQVLEQMVNQIAQMSLQAGEAGLNDQQMAAIEATLQQMTSPQAEAFAEEVRQENEALRSEAEPEVSRNRNGYDMSGPLIQRAPGDSEAVEEAAGSERPESSGKKNIFQIIIDAIVKFFKAIFGWVGSIFRSDKDENKVVAVAAAANPPTQVDFSAPNLQGDAESHPEQDNYLRDYARPAVTAQNDNFQRYLSQVQAGNQGEFYQRSQHHDDTKFVPTYPMAAYHESGVYRGEADPYAVGAISRPRQQQDLGGKSYGTYQFESSVYANGSHAGTDKVNSSTLARFVRHLQGPMGDALRNAAQQHGLASREFDQAWLQLATANNKEFGAAQEAFMFQDKQNVTSEFFQIAQLSDEVRNDPRIIDLIVGTTNHVGGLAKSAAQHIANLQQQAGRKLTADEVGQHIAAFKQDNIPNWFISSPEAHAGLEYRFVEEGNMFA